MRIRTLAAAGIGALLVLTGCVGGDPLPTLPPEPTSTPIFASEEEALAAAEEAYAAYLEMSNLISSEGGVAPERIAPLVTEERLDDELRGFATVRENGLRIVGSTTFEILEIQRVEFDDSDAEVTFYACWDASDSRVLDESGADVTPTDRIVVAVLEVSVVTVGGEQPLVLASDVQWPELSC